MTPTRRTDVVVLGSGAAGLVAALAARVAGADVVLLERAASVGGTTAISGGTCWVPNNGRAEPPDSRADGLAYLASLSHGLIDPELAATFVDHGPEVVDWIEANTELRFQVVAGFPDYHPERPGGRPHGGRSLDPGLFPFPRLGPWAERVVRPRRDPYLTLPETDLGGGDGRIDPAEQERRRAGDLRGCGAALVGGLLAALLDQGVEPQLEHRAVDLVRDGTTVVGVEVDTPVGRSRVHARGGVVLATGGFEWDPTLVRTFLRGPMDSPASYPTNTGDGLRMAMRAGAALGMVGEAWWVPVLRIPGDEQFGEQRSQLVLRERTLPRSIIVNTQGRRFANEAANYNALGGAFHHLDPTTFDYTNLPCWLVFDQTHWERYGFAGFRGDTVPAWVTSAPTLAGLADSLGIPAGALDETVARWNGFVAAGHDDDFARGDSAYDRWSGDRQHLTSHAATLGPLDTGPFHAAELHAGCLGTKGGPRTDAAGRVVDHDGDVIPGLYAAGNTMSCVTGMVYGGAGGTLGPAIAFGHLAGTDAALRARSVAAAGAPSSR